MNRRPHHQQGDRLWLCREAHLLDRVATYDQRLTVFTGPAFAADDPFQRGA